MSPLLRHNLKVAPAVLFIRVPLLFPFWLLIKGGELGEKVFEKLSPKLPTFKSSL